MKMEYAFVPESFNKSEFNYTRAREYAEMLLYSVIAFSLPFVLGHEQLLVGAAVNCALVLAALNLRGARLLPVIILPSVGAFLAGLMFGGAAQSLLYLMPFIWAGNAALVLAVKELVLARGTGRLRALAMGASAKAAFLFISALALFSLGLIPAQFLAAMGMFQLATALAGGAAAFAIQGVRARV